MSGRTDSSSLREIQLQSSATAAIATKLRRHRYVIVNRATKRQRIASSTGTHVQKFCISVQPVVKNNNDRSKYYRVLQKC